MLRARQSITQLHRNDVRRLKGIAGRLIGWFATHGREFQWRGAAAGEYERICVEVLLQRTRAERIDEYFDWFFFRFPNWESLRWASIAELEAALMPLGLWRRRAQALSGLAKYATASGGRFPSNRTELEAIPAVGQYVASAILLFQHGQSEPLLDSNMARVLERYVRPRKLSDIRYDPWLQAAGKKLVSSADPIKTNWAVLDLGGMICRPQRADCAACPIKRGCSYARRSQSST